MLLQTSQVNSFKEGVQSHPHSIHISIPWLAFSLELNVPLPIACHFPSVSTVCFLLFESVNNELYEFLCSVALPHLCLFSDLNFMSSEFCFSSYLSRDKQNPDYQRATRTSTNINTFAGIRTLGHGLDIIIRLSARTKKYLVKSTLQTSTTKSCSSLSRQC